MELSDNNWLSLGVAEETFYNLLEVLIDSYGKDTDEFVCERTFAEQAVVSALNLEKTSPSDFEPIFYAGSNRYLGKLTNEIFFEIKGGAIQRWERDGLENLSFYRNKSCYLETITHDNMIFIRTTREEFSKLKLNCDVFTVAQGSKG